MFMCAVAQKHPLLLGQMGNWWIPWCMQVLDSSATNRLDLGFDIYSLLFVNGQNGQNFDTRICMYAC